MLIEAADFEIGTELHVLALQGDWGLKHEAGPAGGRIVIDDPERAHRLCMGFIGRLRDSTAQLALVPELAIPRGSVKEVVEAIRDIPRSLVFIGGIEGLTRHEYENLLSGDSHTTQPLVAGSPESYINAMIGVVKSPSTFRTFVRAKRVASKEENQGPEMSRGTGPFAHIKLGAQPISMVPLVCSEFVWPEELWTLLDADANGPIDLIPVLQHSSDAKAEHIAPQLHHGYTRTGTKQTRFVFANQALGEKCDGTCYVVVPPKTPGAPTFDHARNELWSIPHTTGYKGFRIPDLTGCIWAARIVLPHAPTSALGTPICDGRVTEVLTPDSAPFNGMAIGLMRSAAASILRSLKGDSGSEVNEVMSNAVDRHHHAFVLRLLTSGSAKDVFFRMQNGESLSWENISEIVSEFIEAASLFAAGRDEVLVMPFEAGNCRVREKAVQVIHAPDADRGITNWFASISELEGRSAPSGLLLIGNKTGSLKVDAVQVGDLVFADRISSSSSRLTGAPGRVIESSVKIRAGEIEFRTLDKLRANSKAASCAAARIRLEQLFPKAYA